MAIGVNTNISSDDLGGQSAGTKTITKPTGTANTDILIVVWALDDGAGVTPTLATPSGWTLVNTKLRAASGSNSISLYTFWSLGSNAVLGFVLSNPGPNIGYVCVGFTGVDNTTPIDATGTTNSTTGSASLTTNAVTVATDQAWHCIPCVDWNGGASDAFTATGFTAKQNGGVNATAGLLYNTTPKSIGSTGTVAVTSSDSATGQILAAMPFALRPAASSDILAAQCWC